MDKYTNCIYCKRKISRGMLLKHTSPCKKVFDNKEYIIKTYKFKIKNIDKLASHIGVGRRILRDWLDIWEVSINSIDGKFGRVYNLNDDFLDNMLEEQYWFLGLIASDGHVKDLKNIFIGQSGDEGKKLIEYVKKLLNAESIIHKNKTIGKDHYRLIFTSKKIAKELNLWNINERKTYNFSIPLNKKIEDKYLKDFLRGYIEGDGSIGIYKNNSGSLFLILSFVGTEKFLSQINKELPIKGKLRKLTENTFELRWNGEKALKMCNWVYSSDNLYIGKKYSIFKKFTEIYEPKYIKYEKVKNIVKKRLEKGENPMEFYQDHDISYGTIYKWKREWGL